MKNSGLNCYRVWVVMHLLKEYLSNYNLNVCPENGVTESKFKISRHYKWCAALSRYSSIPLANRNFVAAEGSNID